ncbi:P-loop containing nucleoside triphosphate hydrolase protein [Parathielavia appendiculata]|uniref:ATP-dependent RNA helicase n=1 Tax=Parathielavia appendiculata TaxID=2587402 RepID=A0AAN6TX27_9PEZI|nr:P-loop containing nucleoside triphosphate hydrolase protein [Parathielavia appendiculata]
MADDGMLLNFELGDAPLKSQVKFKGGRWRDRVKAQRSAKKLLQNGSTQPKRTTGDFDSSRPVKRPRIEDGDSSRHSKMAKTADASSKAPSHAMKTGQISSSLFTSNPVAVTDFAQAQVEDVEPVKASNAPLSEEAENFHTLGLSRRVAQHLATKLDMKAPTAIQKNTVPHLIKEDSDAFLQAETGSGKTLAYLLPIVHRIMALSFNEDGTPKATKVHRNSGLFAIILAPTRELCKQISVVLEKLLRCAPWLVCTTVIGGESKHSEKARIRKGVNILIATPGRLADHLDNTKVLNVGTVRWLVLDEGDRMMEMGFEEDIRTIVGKIRADKLQKENAEGVVLDGILPSRRVTVLCSATMKMNVQKLGEISLEDAVHITASKSEMEQDAAAGNETVFAAPSQLKQSCIIVPAKLRLVTLIALLKSTFARKGSVMKAIIFISCADSVDFHYELLKDTKTPEPPTPEFSPTKPERSPHTDSTVAPAAYITSPANPRVVLHKLHGSLAQPVRSATLESFSKCKDPAVLITTDISSRGLDVPAVDLVIEYDPAFAVPDHVHRIGRTARAGRPGKAVLFLLPGCEEGYTSILPASTPITPQLYESVLQKGLATPVNLLSSQTKTTADGTEKQTWSSRAEALQLHIEQRLLAKPAEESTEDGSAAAASSNKGKGSKPKHHQQKASRPKPVNNLLLDAARQAFRSHIRAYATHVREERVYFDITQLHLGHLAKAFGLRETPGGIGGGLSRRAHKGGAAEKKVKVSSAGKVSTSGGGGGGGDGGGSGGRRDGDDDDDGVGAVDEGAARRMKEKMRMVMNAASEFNLG